MLHVPARWYVAGFTINEVIGRVPAGYCREMVRLFHVSSAANRDSILEHGLDWTRMGAAPGIAGSTVAEAAGVFLCADEFEVGFFTEMNNTGGPVDVWAVTGIDEQLMVESASGFRYYPAPIPAGQVALVERPADEGTPGLPAARGEKKRRRKKTMRPSR